MLQRAGFREIVTEFDEWSKPEMKSTMLIPATHPIIGIFPNKPPNSIFIRTFFGTKFSFSSIWIVIFTPRSLVFFIAMFAN